VDTCIGTERPAVQPIAGKVTLTYRRHRQQGVAEKWSGSNSAATACCV